MNKSNKRTRYAYVVIYIEHGSTSVNIDNVYTGKNHAENRRQEIDSWEGFAADVVKRELL